MIFIVLRFSAIFLRSRLFNWVDQMAFNDFPNTQLSPTSTPQDSASFYSKFGKRVLDLGLALAIAPLVLPVIGLLVLLVRRDGGPGIFAHTRIGKDGVPFKCYKIRSMVVDAEAKLEAYLAANPEARAEWERDVKLANDPRITKFGNFLRKSSLDELPQLFNVFSGAMSFVGPRPVPAKELERYGAAKSVYESLRPGITGLWQVSGRNDVTYDERIEMDRDYANTVSMGLDLSIIARTAGAVLNRTGK